MDLFWGLTQTARTGIGVFVSLFALFSTLFVIYQTRTSIKQNTSMQLDSQQAFKLEQDFRIQSLKLLEEQNNQLKGQLDQQLKNRLFDNSVFYSLIDVEYKNNTDAKGYIEIEYDISKKQRYWNVTFYDVSYKDSIPSSHLNGIMFDNFTTKAKAIKHILTLYNIISYYNA